MPGLSSKVSLSRRSFSSLVTSVPSATIRETRLHLISPERKPAKAGCGSGRSIPQAHLFDIDHRHVRETDQQAGAEWLLLIGQPGIGVEGRLDAAQQMAIDDGGRGCPACRRQRFGRSSP